MKYDRNALTLTTNRAEIAPADVYAVFATAEWTKARTLRQIGRMLEHSGIVVLARYDSKPVGFARAVSDLTFRAFVEDVIVVPDFRSKGIGRALMASLDAVAAELSLPRLELTTMRTAFWNRLGYSSKPSTTYMVKNLSATLGSSYAHDEDQ